MIGFIDTLCQRITLSSYCFITVYILIQLIIVCQFVFQYKIKTETGKKTNKSVCFFLLLTINTMFFFILVQRCLYYKGLFTEASETLGTILATNQKNQEKLDQKISDVEEWVERQDKILGVHGKKFVDCTHALIDCETSLENLARRVIDTGVKAPGHKDGDEPPEKKN